MSEKFDGIFSELSKAGYFKTINDINQSLETKINLSEKGYPNGVAPLDQNGLVPSVYLPSYVDDVLEYPSQDAFPVSGESTKIYVALDEDKIFRWSGSTYIEISPSPGSTDSVPEGSVNLYFTNSRAQAAVTTISGNAATASKLQNARTISLSGDASGSVSFDGSSSVTIATTVADDSHRHSISTVDGLGTVATYNVPVSGNASAGQVVLGNDTRLSDSRPASDVSSWAKASVKPSYTAAEVGAQPLDNDLTSIASIIGSGILGRDSSGAWAFSDGVETAFSSVPRIYLGSSPSTGIDCNDLGYGVAVVSVASNSTYNTNKPQFKASETAYVYIQTIRGFDEQSGNGKIQIAWPLNKVGGGTGVLAFRSVASNSITFSDWEFVVCNMATTSDYGYMTTAQVSSLEGAVKDIATLKSGKEPLIGILPVSKGGTGVSTLTGIAKFNGTSAIQAATSTDILALVPDASTSQSGKMTTTQVSALNELGGLVSMGSGIVKKTLSTAGLDTYTTAVITDLVTSTNLVPNLNADMLDGNHASAFATATQGAKADTALQPSDIKEWAKAPTRPTYTASDVGAQPLDGDLTAIAGLSGASGLLKKTATDTWALDTTTYLPLYGGTMTGDVLLKGDATQALHPVTLQQLQSVVAGLKPKTSVKSATTANIALSGTQIIDSVSLVVGDRVLVKNQTTPSQNGIYVVASGAWSRASDADAWLELVAALVVVEQGTVNADCGWVCTSDQGGTLGTTAVTWTQFFGAGTVTAGTGILINGTQVSLDTLTNSGVGSLLKITRDAYGRVSGTSSVTSSDILGVLGTSVVTGLDADKLDGLHASSFALSGHTHGSLDSIAGTGVGLLAKTSTSGGGTYSSAQIASLTTTGLTVSGLSTNGLINLSLDTGLDNFAGFSDNAANVGLVKLSAVNSFAKASSDDIVALMPDATASQAGKMTTAQVSSLNELSGLVSMGSGIVKKTLSTAGLDTYTTAVIKDLVTSTDVVPNLNADMLDGNHASDFALSGHTHDIATTSSAGFLSPANVEKLNALTVSRLLQVTTVDAPPVNTVHDLNNFITNGFFHHRLSSYASTGHNYPTPHAGMLKVTANDTMVYQWYHTYNNTGVYFRSKYISTWYPWCKLFDTVNTTSNDIVALMPDASTSQSGKMTTTQVSALNELSGLVSLGSGVVKKTLSTNNIDTYTTAVISDLVTSTNVVSNLNADMLDGLHVNNAGLTTAAHIPFVGSDGVMEVGKYIDFHAALGSDFEVRLEAVQVTTSQPAELRISGGKTSRSKVWHDGNHGAGSGLDADTLDGKHASEFSLSGHTHGSLDAITRTGVGLLFKTSTDGVGTYSSAQIASLTTTGLTVSGLSTNGLINLSLDAGLDNFAGFSDNSANVGLVKLSAVNSFAKATSNDIVALMPDASTSQSGKMTTTQVSALNELGGLVSMGSGIVKKTLSAAGPDTYTTAAISDLVTSTNVVTNLNADMLDGLHVSDSGTTSAAHIPFVGSNGVMEIGKYIDFHLAPGNDYDLRLTSALNANGTANIPNLYLKGGTITSDAIIWHSGNDGEGSSLDADLLDGIQATGFLRSNTSTMYSGNTLTMATNLKYTPSSTLTTQGIITYGAEDDTGYCRLRYYGRDASNAITGARFGWSTGTRYINLDVKPDPILPAYDCINIFPTTTSAQVALRIDGNLVWHDANDGPGSGLNADLIDNLQGSQLVRNDITNQELKGFSLGAPAGTSLSNGIVFNRGLDNASGWSLKSSGTTASPVFTLVDTFTDNLLRPRYEWSNSAYYPTTTNTISLGSSSSKWSVVYATTGTINTSDARMKTSVEQFTPNELMASKLLADEIGLYKFFDSISSKGDQARRHVGMTVQRAIEIMTQCGLEPFDYGFICYDEWVDDSGETQSQYAFRYDQLNMFIIRGLSERIKALESH